MRCGAEVFREIREAAIQMAQEARKDLTRKEIMKGDHEMTVGMSCANGHHWEGVDRGKGSPRPRNCPKCGLMDRALAMAMLEELDPTENAYSFEVADELKAARKGGYR